MRDEAAYKKSYRQTEIGRVKLYASQLKKRCRDKGLRFDLDEAWLLAKIQYGRCEQSGIPFDFKSYYSRRSPWSFSLDRIDPAKGYTKSNTQAVVWAYNAAKGIGCDEHVYFFARCLLGMIPLDERGKITRLPLNGKARKLRKQ